MNGYSEVVQAAIDKHIKQKHKLTDKEFLQIRIISCMDYINSLEESITGKMDFIEKLIGYTQKDKERLLFQQELLERLNQEFETVKEGENNES